MSRIFLLVPVQKIEKIGFLINGSRSIYSGDEAMHLCANEVVGRLDGVSSGGEVIKSDSCRIPSDCKSS